MSGTVTCTLELSEVGTIAQTPNRIDRFFSKHIPSRQYSGCFPVLSGGGYGVEGGVGADTRKRRKSLDFFGSNANSMAFVSKEIEQLAERFTENHEGKFKVEEYFQNNHPTTEELANFIKDLRENQMQGFGIKNYASDQNGVTFTDLSRYSWEQIAQAAVRAMERSFLQKSQQGSGTR